MLTSGREAPRVADRQAQAEAAARPCRILHVVMRMDRGGIEVSLMQLLRAIDRQRYQMDFLALVEGPGSQDEEVRALGSRVIAIGADHRRPLRFARRFDRIMREYGPYDVIHSHIHFYGGYVLRLAARHGIPLRIAHSRNDTRVAEQGRGWPRRIYVWLMRRWICQYASTARPRPRAQTGGSCASRIGRQRELRSRPDPGRHRPGAARLGLPARKSGIADRVIFTGPRADVRRLLKGAMDAFISLLITKGSGWRWSKLRRPSCHA
jgi:Glycosyltransferase Family 4